MQGSEIKMFFPEAESISHVFLKPAEVFIAWEPTLVTTILGSCITILLFVPKSGVGAICHSLLPYQKRDHGRDLFRYVDSSLDYMLDALHGQSITRRDIVVKLFGGAEQMETSNPSQSVGQQNVVAARRSLESHKLVINSSKTGGMQGYKLYIRTDTCSVFVKRLQQSIWNE